mgnify:CR=1 FL=1
MLERDGFPKKAATQDGLMVIPDRSSPVAAIKYEPEKVQLNWAVINHLPKFIYFHSYDGLPLATLDSIVTKYRGAIHRYLRLTVGFFTPEEMSAAIGEDLPVRVRCQVETEAFLRQGTSDMPGLKPRDAKNIVTSLLRQAWNMKAEGLGFCPFVTANGASAWYLPSGLIPNDQITFIDISGSRRRKKLVGFSQKRRVFWHFALELKPILSDIPRFVLKSHVIFSYNGRDPINSSGKMHALRRGFCRSWWNDRWRDLTAAYLIAVSEGREKIQIATSASTLTEFEAQMIILESPVSFNELSGTFSPDEADIEVDISDEDDLLIASELSGIDGLTNEQ